MFITTRDIVKDRDNGIREIFKSIGLQYIAHIYTLQELSNNSDFIPEFRQFLILGTG